MWFGVGFATWNAEVVAVVSGGSDADSLMFRASWLRTPSWLYAVRSSPPP